MNVRVHDLRDIAADLSSLGRILPGETGHVLLIVADLARIASIIARNRAPHGDPHAQVARRAVSNYSRYAGPPTQAQVDQVRAALTAPHAADVLNDPAWPALAAQLRRMEGSGMNPATTLASAAAARELNSAESIASVLHHRLTTSAPASRSTAAVRPQQAPPGARRSRTEMRRPPSK
jgi:hypothetical protein